MLMFDNGIFATFIPEILMVLGYMLCLIAPGHQRSEKKVEELLSIIEFSEPTSHVTPSTVSFLDHIQVADEVCEQQKSAVLPERPSLINFPTIYFEIKKELSFKLFSRPPPTIC